MVYLTKLKNTMLIMSRLSSAIKQLYKKISASVLGRLQPYRCCITISSGKLRMSSGGLSCPR